MKVDIKSEAVRVRVCLCVNECVCLEVRNWKCHHYKPDSTLTEVESSTRTLYVYLLSQRQT